MLATPAVLPVTTPVPATTDATVALLEDHVPPLVKLLNVVVSPVQTVNVPVIVDGFAFMVIACVTKHAFAVV